MRRFYDKAIWLRGESEEIKFVTDFICKLISLHRRTFLGVMRAIRRYINGMNRIADDLEWAYILLVVSVESLAQELDEYQSGWQSVHERKRKAIDQALVGTDESVAQRVRETLLRVEHTALARRFREFTTVHTNAEYFRQVFDEDGTELGR